MTHEMMVGLTVTDDAVYQQYREAMAPLLTAHGGGFRYDFTIGKVLKSASDHAINRVFAIYFGSLAQKDAFFAHPDYLAIKAKFFQRSVAAIRSNDLDAVSVAIAHHRAQTPGARTWFLNDFPCRAKTNPSRP